MNPICTVLNPIYTMLYHNKLIPQSHQSSQRIQVTRRTDLEIDLQVKIHTSEDVSGCRWDLNRWPMKLHLGYAQLRQLVDRTDINTRPEKEKTESHSHILAAILHGKPPTIHTYSLILNDEIRRWINNHFYVWESHDLICFYGDDITLIIRKIELNSWVK